MKVHSSQSTVLSLIFGIALFITGTAKAYVTTSPGGGSSGGGGSGGTNASIYVSSNGVPISITASNLDFYSGAGIGITGTNRSGHVDITITNPNGTNVTTFVQTTNIVVSILSSNSLLGTFAMYWKSNNISSTNISLDFSTNALQRYKCTNAWGSTNIYFTLSQTISNQQFIPLEYLVVEGNTNGVHIVMPSSWIWLSEGGSQQAPNYVTTGAVLHVTIQNFSDGVTYAMANYGVAFDPDVNQFFAGLPPSILTNLFPSGPPAGIGGGGSGGGGGAVACGDNIYNVLTSYVATLKANGAWDYIKFLNVFPYCASLTGTNVAYFASLNLRYTSNNVAFTGNFLQASNFSAQGVLYKGQSGTVSVPYFEYDSQTNVQKFLATYLVRDGGLTNDWGGSSEFLAYANVADTFLELTTGTNFYFPFSSDVSVSVTNLSGNSARVGGFNLAERYGLSVNPVSATRPLVYCFLDDGTVISQDTALGTGSTGPSTAVGFEGILSGGILGFAAGGNAMPPNTAGAFRDATKNLMASLGRTKF